MTKLDLIKSICKKILKKNNLNLIIEPYSYMKNTIILQITNSKKLSIETLYIDYMLNEKLSVIIKKLKFKIKSIKNYYDYQK